MKKASIPRHRAGALRASRWSERFRLGSGTRARCASSTETAVLAERFHHPLQVRAWGYPLRIGEFFVVGRMLQRIGQNIYA
jgi:hypothetical protein